VYVLWRLPRARSSAVVAALVLAGAAVAVAPWLVRNKVDVGCWTVTTDGRAMFKANNVQTYGLLSSGHWIDELRNPPRPQPPNYWTPEEAYVAYQQNPARGRRLYPNECAAMSFYEHETFRYWHHHAGQKAKLMALSARLLWQPSVFETSERPGAGGQLDIGRRVIEPAYMIVLYALAVAGLFLVPRAFAALVVLLLAYNTATALVFVGATRYRVAWDFLLALLAAATLTRVAERVRTR
jgi:hypothetical protein